TQTAKELTTKSVQVVSALEKGIPAAAHLGCKAAGGYSFAVLENGFDQISGEVEIPLAIDIVQTGGIFSEYPPDAVKVKSRFSQANRLMAGMTQAVVVTEFYENSIRVHDILEYCHQVGKLSFVLTDPKNGALSDEKSLALAVKKGAIIMSGPNRIDDIIKALV
ncbi:MAG TPA: DNA-processing protein DprA, partial [candidate division Zixibacteria bacterium]|nr:DNA-processing protein DprA [candidate division Zixibacteria bacterium]